MTLRRSKSEGLPDPSTAAHHNSLSQGKFYVQLNLKVKHAEMLTQRALLLGSIRDQEIDLRRSQWV